MLQDFMSQNVIDVVDKAVDLGMMLFVLGSNTDAVENALLSDLSVQHKLLVAGDYTGLKGIKVPDVGWVQTEILSEKYLHSDENISAVADNIMSKNPTVIFVGYSLEVSFKLAVALRKRTGRTIILRAPFEAKVWEIVRGMEYSPNQTQKDLSGFIRRQLSSACILKSLHDDTWGIAHFTK